MNCPVDGTLLTIADRSGIEIDWCPQCRGVWLDRGELDKVIERAAADLSGGGSRRRDDDDRYERGYRDDRDRDRDRYRGDRDRYRDDDDDYRHGRRRKKGGLLGELFDFD
jgi:Zn-finger nucleic acid-binding protein